jgi:hypothetical protein
MAFGIEWNREEGVSYTVRLNGIGGVRYTVWSGAIGVRKGERNEIETKLDSKVLTLRNKEWGGAV